MKSICIIDYGMGNIKSLTNAIKKIGYRPRLLSEEDEINTNFAIIPGVGAFNSAMKIIKQKNIDKKIKNFLQYKNNFLLGICLGKQLLYSNSEENGHTAGLDIIKGKVNILSNKSSSRLPNVGWKKILINSDINPKFSFLYKFDNEKFYFIHSYVGTPNKKKNILAVTEYNNKKFYSIISNNSNVIGTQFHPEKSSSIGLEFLDSMIKQLG
jgi:glutamine amidotransferase